MLAASATFAKVYSDAATGDATLDTMRVRGRVVLAALRVFGPLTLLGPDGRGIIHALMAIVNNEYDRRHGLDDQVGDTTASGGPSVGPMQVYKKTALDLGLWTVPADVDADDDQAVRDAYAAEAGNVLQCFTWGVRVFRAKLDIEAGDVTDAVRAYNGSGPAAQAYQDKALAFAQATWSDTPAGVFA